MKFKKLFALGLSIAMVLTTIGCGNDEGTVSGNSEENQGGESSVVEEAKDLSWLNSDGTLPIVKEGTEKTL